MKKIVSSHCWARLKATFEGGAKDPGMPIHVRGHCKIWQVKMKVVHVVVGVLGTIPKALGKHFEQLGTTRRMDLLLRQHQ